MGRCFLILIVLLPVQAYAQQEACFKKWFDRGIIAFNAYDMRAAVANFEAALECDGISSQDSIEIERWKKKIDIELQKLVAEFEAAEGKKEAFNLLIADEKINSAVSFSDEKNYIKANEYLKDALTVIENLSGHEKTGKENEILAMIRKNDSLRFVQNRFLKLIGDGNLLDKSGVKNSIPAFRKYMEASRLNFDTAVTNERMLSIKERTRGCLIEPCLPVHNNEDTYYTLATFEQLLDNTQGARDLVNSGLQLTKLRYYPSSQFYPAEIYNHADELCSDYYLAKNIIFFQLISRVYTTLKFEKAAFTDPYKKNIVDIKEQLFGYNYNFELETRNPFKIIQAEPSFMFGYFRSLRKLIYGVKYVASAPSTGPEEDLGFQFEYKNATSSLVDTVRAFQGTAALGGHCFDLSLGYQFPLVRKKNNKHIVLCNVLPLIGPGIRINSPWIRLGITEKLISNDTNISSETLYSYAPLKSSSLFLTTALYLNIRVFARTYFSAGLFYIYYWPRKKYHLSAQDILYKQEISTYEKHTHLPLGFEWAVSEYNMGWAIAGFYTRF